MSNLTLDGSTSFIGNEFIKLLATGSSNLATEEYVDDKIAEGGGGGNVDLSNYYTQTETDGLLNNKLNVNNPQDIIGTLRIDSTNGNGKLIVNAVGAPNDEDFYVNGLSNLGGTLKCQLLQASRNIETSQQIKSDTYNTNTNTNIVIQRNSIDYIVLESDKVNFKKDIYINDVLLTGSGGGTFNEDVIIADTFQLKTDTITSNGFNDLVFNIDTLGEYLRFNSSNFQIQVPDNRLLIAKNFFSNIIKPLTIIDDISLQGQNNTNDNYEEYVKINSTNKTVDISKEVNASENIVMLPNKILYLDEGTTNKRYIRSSARSSPSIQNHLDIVQENTSIGRIRLMIGSEENLIVENSQLYSLKVITAVSGVKGNVLNSNGNNNLNIQRNGTSLIILNSSNEIQLQGDLRLPTSNTQYIKFPNCNIRQGVATVVYFDFNVDTATGQYRFFIDSNTILNLTPLNTTISNTLQVNTINSNGNNVVNLQQNGNTFISLQGGNNRVQVNRFLRVVDSGAGTQCHFVQNSTGNYMSFTLGNHINAYASGGGNGNTFHINYYSHGNVMLGTNQDTTPDPKPTISINKFSSDTGNAFEVAGDSVFSGTVSTNTLNSEGDNDVVFQRNDVDFFKLDKFTEDTVEKEAIICSKQLRANGNILVKNLQINQFPVGVEYCDFRLENADSIMRFYAGNSTSVNFQITNDGLTLGRVATCNSGIKTNVIDTTIDTDLIFRRNGVEYFRLDDLTGTDILNVANDKGVSASYVFGNRFWNRSFSSDTTFFGSNVAGDDRVEYMKWNYLSQSVDYNAPIDNTGLAITGNIIDTTVSDERLKTNIEDVDTDFTSCIKNVKVKTFKYKDDKYKTNDNYGFIAQELKEHLPKECKNIVKENKVKNEDETFLSINYMKLSVVLWKCCQEQQSKIENLESSMYEMMEDIKELKGKKTTKPKAKAKSKTKVEK